MFALYIAKLLALAIYITPIIDKTIPKNSNITM